MVNVDAGSPKHDQHEDKERELADYGERVCAKEAWEDLLAILTDSMLEPTLICRLAGAVLVLGQIF